MLNKYIGNKKFYRMVFAIAVPIMIQNGITNFVNMLDNVMIGMTGTEQMTGVAVANQLIFVFNLCIFGAVSGAGIFGAQFYGSGDHKGLRDTFRFKLISCTAITVICMFVFYFFGDTLISLYLHSDNDAASVTVTLGYGKEYLNTMLIGLLPYTVVQCYSGTLRETGKTVVPMYAGIAAVLVNLTLNYILIFGNFGAPALGVKGAAIATVISRFAELAIVAIYTHTHRQQNQFIIGAYRSLRIPRELMWQITLKGLPLMLNETMWAAGMAMLNQCYSLRGLDVVAANNISTTFWNVFSVAFLSIGVSVGIILGQMLGANNIEGAKDTARKLITFSVIVSVVVGVLYSVFAFYIPRLYDTTDEIRSLATSLMLVSVFIMPIDAFANASYFTLRSGGKAFITFLFDSVFVWCVNVPVALVISRYTSVPAVPMFAICQGVAILKCIIGYIFVKKGVWIKKLVD